MVQYRAQRHVHQTQEELQVGRAIDFDQRRELDDFEAGLLLARVAERVGHDGHVVGDVLTDGHRDRLAFVVRRKGGGRW